MFYLLLALMGASMFTSCSKDHELEQHDTVYTFSRTNPNNLKNLEQIAASADSAEVRNIIFKVVYESEQDTWEGASMTRYYDNLLEYAFRVANGKGRGNSDGVFRGVFDNDYNRAAEDLYKKLGWKGFEFVTPGGYFPAAGLPFATVAFFPDQEILPVSESESF